MKNTIITSKTQKEHDHMITCIEEQNLPYRLQMTLTGVNDIEVYHSLESEITDLKNLYNQKLQTSIF